MIHFLLCVFLLTYSQILFSGGEEFQEPFGFEGSLKPLEDAEYISIGTFNIQGWKDHNPWIHAHMIKDVDLSIVVLQEGSERNAAGNLANALGSDWLHRGNFLIRNDILRFGNMVGQKIISHKRYIDHATIFTKRYDIPITVFNTHWDHNRDWRNDQNMYETKKFINDYASAFYSLIGGDFNRYPTDQMFEGYGLSARGVVYGSVDAIYYRNVRHIESGRRSGPSDHDLLFSRFALESLK